MSSSLIEFVNKDSKTATINFDRMDTLTIGALFNDGARTVHVNDDEFGDYYTISLSISNLGVGGMCFLNGEPSYQADFMSGKWQKLSSVVAKIAGQPAYRVNDALMNRSEMIGAL